LFKELILLKNENDRLNGKIATLRMTTNTLTKQLTEEKNKIAKVTEEFYVKLFEDEEYQCPICRDIFIKVQLKLLFKEYNININDTIKNIIHLKKPHYFKNITYNCNDFILF